MYQETQEPLLSPTVPQNPQMVTQWGRIPILLELTKPSSSRYPLPSTTWRGN